MSSTATSAKGTFIFYHYDPSMAAAVLFIILFSLSSSYHLYKMIRSRTWYFTIFILGGIFQIAGYAGRAASSTESPNFSQYPYIVQTLFILVAPSLFAASIYMTLGRIVAALKADRLSVIPRRWLTRFFVIGDVVSFFSQAAGGGLMAASKNASTKTAEYIIIAGLVIQLLFFGFFVIVAAIFHRRYTDRVGITSDIWPKSIYALYAASVLIFVRSLFRTIEYAQGNDGYLLAHEVFIYVFDALLMFAVMVIYNVMHPADISRALRAQTCEKCESAKTGNAVSVKQVSTA